MRSKKTLLAVGMGAVTAMIAVGVGVANAATVSEQPPRDSIAAQQTVRDAAKGPADGAPTDLANWSDTQRAAATIASQALLKKGGGVKPISAAKTRQAGVYQVEAITALHGSFRVTVNTTTRTVLDIQQL